MFSTSEASESIGFFCSEELIFQSNPTLEPVVKWPHAPSMRGSAEALQKLGKESSMERKLGKILFEELEETEVFYQPLWIQTLRTGIQDKSKVHLIGFRNLPVLRTFLFSGSGNELNQSAILVSLDRSIWILYTRSRRLSALRWCKKQRNSKLQLFASTKATSRAIPGAHIASHQWVRRKNATKP